MEIMTDHGFRKTVKYLRAFIIISLIGMICMLVLFLGILAYAKILGAPPLAVPQSTLFYADDGTLIGESNSGQKRYWVGLKDISPDLVNATVSIEDKSFYSHHGFDLKRIAGAVLADIQAFAKVQGASTITQQYARNLFLEHDKTWNRKLHEAFYTIRLEMNYSKNDILEGYLNTIYYGNGAYGVEAASQYYFGKKAADLTLAEASMLAGIPKGPGLYSPLASMENAKRRQAIILATMVKNGYIQTDTAKTVAAEKLTITGSHTAQRVKVAPYFQDAVKNALKNQLHLDDRTIALGGLKVFTTLDLNQQEAAERQVQQYVSNSSEIQVGLVAMDPKNGYLKAMVGGRDYEKSPFNRAVQAIRQPGSTIKPLLYYAALEQGFTPSSTMRSEYTTFHFDDGQADYTPHNFNNKYADGEITMAQALAVSDNIFAVKTHLFLGEETLIETAKRFGLSTKMAQVPSLALGTSGVRVIEMANAYSLLANGGKRVNPTLITRVEDYNGHVIFEKKQEAKKVLDPAKAFVLTQMLTGIFDKKLNGYAKVTGSTIINDLTRPYAGKSGSTETDSWMIGYSPQLVTAVWAGYDIGKPIELTAEKTYAKNIWAGFMEEALEGKPVKSFTTPKEGVIGVYVDPANGKLATKDCPVRRFTYFVAGTEPTEYCTDHLKNENPDAKKEKVNKKVPWYKKIMPWS
ncbi:transglycosylase domain-containing protein [Neobacillus vireti]|uniref:Penicillin-binding protein, 1A family n=1 Tax=Neobacillus vireti LMG 21834 TaxID=1131730 RepID=A0AB94ISA8_9BACI|nr:PBP1A family penicillin-binding protein [Neobacillus vireti]ETI69843.1 penicillin-binding protein, 1A family [Neobacillus vireti LMG 21834]KLT16665.1 penicillin-binding protein [Neobacillus vireti]